MNFLVSAGPAIGVTSIVLMGFPHPDRSVDDAEFLPFDAEDLENFIEMLVLVRRHVARPHNLHPLRDAGADEGVNEHAGIEERPPEPECDQVVTDDHRYDSR